MQVCVSVCVCVRLSGLVWFTIFKSQLSQFAICFSLIDFLFMRNYSALYGSIRGVYKLSANRVQQCTLTLAGAAKNPNSLEMLHQLRGGAAVAGQGAAEGATSLQLWPERRRVRGSAGRFRFRR